MTKPDNPNDRKLTESEKLEIYNSFTSSEKWFYGSAEDFCSKHDVYENAAAPWSFYFVDKA